MQDLPAAFAGDPSIVFVAFDSRQQGDVDSWLPFLDELRARLPGLEVYELPAIKRRYLPARSYIDSRMRAGISDRGTRQRTLTLYTDVSARNPALRIDSTSTIALFVVSRGGNVMWSGSGVYDAATAAGLKRSAAAARSTREPRPAP